jgi:hypothetical protein
VKLISDGKVSLAVFAQSFGTGADCKDIGRLFHNVDYKTQETYSANFVTALKLRSQYCRRKITTNMIDTRQLRRLPDWQKQGNDLQQVNHSCRSEDALA